MASFASDSMASALAIAAEHLRRITVQVSGARRGGGSGVIWHPKGLIITNAHVASLRHPSVALWDGRSLRGSVVARDPGRDLAAVLVRAENLFAATVRPGNSLRVGELVLAIGSPWGFAGAAAIGVVHGLIPRTSDGTMQWVQADVRLAPGNSGGPLADAQGRVVAINSMVAGGLALAIATDEVERFLSESGVLNQPRAATRGEAA